jgi:Predicted translation initiation factor 2B subunit, eIF-2B alpha/beta/delta family
MKMARPTAVNLFWAVDEMIEVCTHTRLANIYGALLRQANEIERQDQDICSRIADQGADIFKGHKHLKILTHGNAGALATAGIGTALGVITRLHQHGQLS